MIQIIAFIIEIIDFPIDGRILVGGITDAAVPYDVGIVAVIRIIPARTCRHIDRSLPFLTVIGNTGMIAVADYTSRQRPVPVRCLSAYGYRNSRQSSPNDH